MKILLVEDNRDIAENVADYLEPRGHTLDFAVDGRQGLALATSAAFDVIVLDVMLPRLDGMTLCRRLREEYDVTTPVLMLTARDQLDDKLEGFACGADDYLVKPFSVKELEARLHALLKRVDPAAGERVLRVADLAYDQRTLQVHRAGRRIDLNPVQRRLLALLMARSPAVVSRADLERQVWGDDPPDNDVLRSHVYALRTAIDRPFPERLLHTVHGTGYRLGAEAS